MIMSKVKWIPLHNSIQVAYFKRRLFWSKLLCAFIITYIVYHIWFLLNDRRALLSNKDFRFKHIQKSVDLWKLDRCSWRRSARDRFTCQAAIALQEHEQWVSSQSKTLLQAERQYQRRYRRTPPKWFKAWFKYCRENNVTIIDDYDQLELDLMPFRTSNNKDLIIKAMEDVAKREGSYDGKGGKDAIAFISYLKVKDGQIDINFPRAPEIVRALSLIIDPIKYLLPDLNILVSWGDEPLVRGPEHELTYDDLPPIPHRETARSIASFDTKPCPISGVLDTKSIGRLYYKPRHDPCKPKDLSVLINRHGKFQHPGTQYNVTFPLLSSAKMTEHQDILFPMRGDVYGLYKVNSDPIPWEDKSDSLFWRGATSGQENTDQNWNMTHRSRFVFDAQMWNRTIKDLNDLSLKDKEVYIRQLSKTRLARERDLSRSGIEALSRLPLNTFNVSFTKYTFCHQHGCEKIEEVSPKAPKTPSETIRQHKFLFDIDGLGMSERYYGLLLSNSVVLKQTEWAEWHDEYLVPWVHFIPVSLGMEELPELMDFLINDKQGQAVARRIAKDSSKWVANALSFKAQAAFMLRLLNEYSDVMYGVKN